MAESKESGRRTNRGATGERGTHAADRISDILADGPAPIEAEEAIRQSLAGVGARLRGLRQEQGRTLEKVAELAGMSTSTLSRLESGKRKPSLELLLPLAGVYGLPLDELVGTPPIGDPRIHISPRKFHDQTVLPLSRGAIGEIGRAHV